MSNGEDRRVQRVEQITVAVVASIAKLRASLSTIDGGHEAVARLMGKEGEKRIIRLAMNCMTELGYEHKTDRAIRRAIAYKLRSAPIGFTQVEFDRDDRRDGEAAG